MPATSTPQCFVVSAIGDVGTDIRRHSEWVYDGIIKPVFDLHFKDTLVVRADKIATPGMIDAQIINALLNFDLVIADLTWLNPNVFYEIGIRHMAEKPIIHLFLDGTAIPFDVKPYRAIPFKLEMPDDLEGAKKELKAAIDAVRTPDFEVENPVTRARGQKKLQEHATSIEKILLGDVNEIKDRLAALEQMAADQAQRNAHARAFMPVGLYRRTGLATLDSVGLPPSPTLLGGAGLTAGSDTAPGENQTSGGGILSAAFDKKKTTDAP